MNDYLTILSSGMPSAGPMVSSTPTVFRNY